jgi:hypothetical protein
MASLLLAGARPADPLIGLQNPSQQTVIPMARVIARFPQNGPRVRVRTATMDR